MTQRTAGVSRGLIVLLVLIILGVATYAFLTMPDQRSWNDKVGDAFHALPQGVGAASEQLENRTPGQKLGDDIKNTGQNVKDNTGAQ